MAVKNYTLIRVYMEPSCENKIYIKCDDIGRFFLYMFDTRLVYKLDGVGPVDNRPSPK